MDPSGTNAKQRKFLERRSLREFPRSPARAERAWARWRMASLDGWNRWCGVGFWLRNLEARRLSSKMYTTYYNLREEPFG